MNTLKQIIKNAKKCAMRDGYDQVIYEDSYGLFFGRDYLGRTHFHDEKIIGRVIFSYRIGGIANVRYVEV